MEERKEQVKKSLRDKGKEKEGVEEDADNDSSSSDFEQEEFDFIPRLKTSKQAVLNNLESLLQQDFSQERASQDKHIAEQRQNLIVFFKKLNEFDEAKEEYYQHLLATVKHFQITVLPGMRVGRHSSVKIGDIHTALQQFVQLVSANVVHINTAFVKNLEVKQSQKYLAKHLHLQSASVPVSASCPTSSDEVPSLIAQLKAVLQTCYRHQPGIPLLLDDSKTFSMDEVFVDLELVAQQKKNKKQQKNFRGRALSDRMERPDNLYERREFKRSDESSKVIQPEELFQQEGKSVNCVFLQGAAGIGKTTLCRHLAYRWAKDELWVNDFELVIYLPLREIIVNYQDKEYDLETFIFGDWGKSAALGQRAIFGKPLITTAHQQALWQFIQTSPTKVLWLLDGLDEVDREHPVIKVLLAYAPCYLVSSRPASVPEGIERCVENIGLSPANRKRYVKRYFTLMQEEEKIQPLIRWLKANPQVWGLSSIAVNCQLLCIAYQQNQQLPQTLSLTQLYELLMIQWQRRAFLRDKALQGKLKRDKLAEWDNQQISAHYSDITHLLGKICYFALVQISGVLIEGSLLKKVIEGTIAAHSTTLTFKETRKAMRKLRKQVLSLGVLKAQGLSTNPYQDRYEFAHLTFVEYLAAYNAVDVLKASSSHEELFEMLIRNPITTMFAAGLLAKHTSQHDKLLHQFFAHLTEYYTSTKKFHHLALCYMEAHLPELNELSTTIEMIIKKDIQRVLKNSSWRFDRNREEQNAYQMLNYKLIQKLELINVVSNTLYRQYNLELALILIDKGKLFFKELKMHLQRLAGKVSNWHTLICIATEMKLGDDYIKTLLTKLLIKTPRLKVTDMMNHIIKKLANLGILKDEVIDILLERLKIEKITETASSIIVLKKLGVRDEQIINPLLKRLQDDDRRVIVAAAELLIKLGINDERIINPLLKCLQEGDSWIIKAAVERLINLEVSDECIINPLLKRLEDSDSEVVNAAAKRLIKLGVCDERIINPLFMRLQDKKVKGIAEYYLRKLGIFEEKIDKIEQADTACSILELETQIGFWQSTSLAKKNTEADPTPLKKKRRPATLLEVSTTSQANQNDVLEFSSSNGILQAGQSEILIKRSQPETTQTGSLALPQKRRRKTWVVSEEASKEIGQMVFNARSALPDTEPQLHYSLFQQKGNDRGFKQQVTKLAKEQLEVRIRKIIGPSLQAAYEQIADDLGSIIEADEEKIVSSVTQFYVQSHQRFRQMPTIAYLVEEEAIDTALLEQIQRENILIEELLQKIQEEAQQGFRPGKSS